MALTKTPKQVLHEFFQIRGGIPQFDVQDGPPPLSPPNFTCRLTIPALPPDADGKPSQTVFTAAGGTKKAAEHAAASNALEHLRSLMKLDPSTGPALLQRGWQQPVPPPWQPPDPQLMPHGPQFVPESHSAGPPLALPPPQPPAGGAAGAHAPSAGQQEQQHQLRQQAGAVIPEAQTLQPGLSAFLDGLSTVEMKRLLAEAQQRIVSLEAQLAKYTDWHRRIRELALEDGGSGPAA